MSQTQHTQDVSAARRRVTFWIFGGIYAVFMAAAAAPSPMYGVYAAKFHFTALVLTVVFAVYAIGLLAALLVTGRLSDHVGRRPVILGAVALQIAAMAVFVAADSTAALLVARAVQGLATGAAIGALTAGIIELGSVVAGGVAALVTALAPVFGLAAGAVGSSALVQYGPEPLRLVFWILIAALLLGAGLTAWAPESGARRPGALAALKPVAAVPAYARPSFVKVMPSLVALWALNGFYLSLAPSLVTRMEGSHNLLWGGAAVFAVTFTSGIAVMALRALDARQAMLVGCVVLLVGVLISLVAIAVTSATLFLLGSVIAGAGFGPAFLGTVRTVSDVAAPHERGGVMAVFYIVSYLAFSVPIVIAGVAQTHFSGHDVALVFSAAVAVLSAVGTVANLRRDDRAGVDPTSVAPSETQRAAATTAR